MAGTEPETGLPGFTAWVGLGGNQGDVAQALASATHALARLPWTRVLAVSHLYRTRPVEATGPDYLNAVVALHSSLGPGELLSALMRIEQDHDRQRPFHHAPRTLDLDLLAFGSARRDSATLTLPHPRMMTRAFVLEPLAQVLQAHPELTFEWPLPSSAQRQALAAAQGIEPLGPLGGV